MPPLQCLPQPAALRSSEHAYMLTLGGSRQICHFLSSWRPLRLAEACNIQVDHAFRLSAAAAFLTATCCLPDRQRPPRPRHLSLHSGGGGAAQTAGGRIMDPDIWTSPVT
ncbi:hypothetical protein BS78_06G063500 [Paspalum vaginatum]|nr:hypothetical protein BS78_06G063500 [Paspalum vaginatum]